MTSSDPSDRPQPAETPETPPPAASEETPLQNDAAADTAEDENADVQAESSEPARLNRILIGSQRDPAAYKARRTRDWVPVVETEDEAPGKAKRRKRAPRGRRPTKKAPHPQRPSPEPESARQGDTSQQEASQQEAPPHEASQQKAPQQEVLPRDLPQEPAPAAADVEAEPVPGQRFPPPSVRDHLTPDLEQEFEKALGDESLDELLAGGDSLDGQPVLEEESKQTGRVVAVQRDDVFVELGSREQGCVSVKHFDEPPEVGTSLEVIVQRFNSEEGLYELTLPGAAVDVEDWSDVHEGMLVEARVTGHNAGGLECEVNHLRGFIPISQISLMRVEDLEQFADEKFTCLVTEANPERRNLVLSRRAVLEREREEARKEFLESLQPGQIHEGVVRKLVDFGAFVDIGSLDGLLHISQLAWGRVQHPNEVLAEGQKIKVKIEKIDHATGKMSLGYREMLENPWDTAQGKYPPNSTVKGTVTKLMEFGAFVELEPGVEGLVHVSELSHKRVWRVSDVVHEGDQIEVLVLSVDPKAQRISLSIRQTLPEPEPKKKEEEEPQPLSKAKSKRKKPDRPLKGGLDKSAGGEGFGLNW